MLTNPVNILERRKGYAIESGARDGKCWQEMAME